MCWKNEEAPLLKRHFFYGLNFALKLGYSDRLPFFSLWRMFRLMVKYRRERLFKNLELLLFCG